MKDAAHREMEQFVEFIDEADTDDVEKFKKEFFHRIDHISDLIEASPEKETLKDDFFRICARMDESVMHQRTRQKPLGYAGDFQLIDWIYTHKTAPSGKGKFLDELFHSFEAAKSVRNRKQYFIKKCIELSHKKKDRLDILNLGCGPCRDVMETFTVSNNGHNMFFHCVDHETEALDYARKLLSQIRMQDHVVLDPSNVFRIKTDKKYDLIWSAGLFDYLEDRIAVLLLKKIWRLLKDGGQIIFGNFSPKNPTRKGMELVGKWYLIHRTADDLVRLCTKAGIPFTEIEIESEELGINLFCVITK